MNWPKRSLRIKIIVWAFVPTAIILTAVAWVTFIAYQRVTEDLVIERNRELTRFSAGEFATRITEYTALLTEYSGFLSGLPQTAYAYEGDLIVPSDLLKRARSRLAVFDGGVLVISNQGLIVATEPERPEILAQNWSGRPYFRQMLRSPGPILSDIVADGPAGAEVIAVAVPIKGDQGQFLGIISGMFHLGGTIAKPFYGDITRFHFGESGCAYLVDRNGRVIHHTDPSYIGHDLSDQAVVQQVLAGQVGAIRTRDFAGREIVASFAPLPGTSWGLVTEESWAALISPGQRYRQFLLVLLGLGVFVPTLVVAVGVRRITRPIGDLIGAAQNVAGGDFGQKITTSSGDEIEELAEQFNLMSAQLQVSYAHLERMLVERTRELATLSAIAAVVSRSLDLKEVLHDALEKSLQVMDVESGGIYLLDEEAGELTIAAYRGFSPQFIAAIDQLKIGEGFSGRVVQSGQPLVATDISTDPRLTRLAVREEGLHSLACAPLQAKGKVFGVLFAITRGYREFTDQDVQLLTSIGHQVGVAIENARLFKAEQRRAEQFRVINEVGHRVTSIMAVDELLAQITRLIREAFDYYQVSIGLIEGDDLVSKAGAGPLSEVYRPLRLKVGQEGIGGYVARSGEPLLAPDVNQESRYYFVPQASQVRSELCLPLKIKEAVIGVLDVQSDQPDAFDESDLTVLQSLANQAASAIENARLYEQARHAAALEERQRLARDLHDSVTQALYGVTLYAKAAAGQLSLGEIDTVADHLRELQETAQEALAEMRLLIHELRPPILQEEGLVVALQARLQTVEGRAGLKTTFKVEGVDRLPPEVEEGLYRIAQEALNNALKHARARHIAVCLSRFLPQSTVTMKITDDGVGFDPTTARSQGGLGLAAIEERAVELGGRTTVQSEPGKGTSVQVEVRHE